MSNKEWLAIERLFHAVMERPFDQREAFLKESANFESEYEAVRKLIDAANKADDFMQTSLGLGAFSPSLSVGQALGVWTILENIGSGGMGEIYKVERRDSDFTQIAALKIARTRHPRYLQHFEQERRILAQLEHPNIGRFIDGGTGPDRAPYFAMELVEGEIMTTYAESKNLSESARLTLFSQLCNAVSHAHSRLVLHRDIKPSNIMVTASGQVKLIDFGTSHDLTDDRSIAPPVTKAYAAPEQLNGGQVTTQTDIFALGCVLHELITGHRTGMDRVTLQPLRADLKVIVIKCLHENPSDRYGSVDALCEDINRYQNSLPVKARKGGFLYILRRSIHRNRLAYGVSFLLFISLITGLVGTYSQMRRAETALVAMQAAELEQEFEARTLTGYAYGLQALYGGNEDDGDAIAPAKIDASMLKLADQVKDRFDGKSLDDAFLLYSMAEVLANRHDFTNAAKFLEPLQNFPMTSPIATNLSIEARSDLARYWREIGKLDAAESMIRRLLADRQMTGIIYDLGHVQDVQTLAGLTGSEQHLDQVIKVGLSTLEIWESDLESPDNISWLHNQVGFAYFKKNQIPDAIHAFEKALFINRQSGITELDDITSATNLAQFQVFLARDGRAPLTYLSDYLDPALNEFGAPHVYAFIQGMRGEAALLNKDWALAASAARDGLPYITDNRAYRDGWYYEMVVILVRALINLEQTGEARAILDTARQEFFQEADTSGWGFTACKLQVMDGYLSVFENHVKAGQVAFDQGEAQCRQASRQGWENELVLPDWIKDLRTEIYARTL